MTIAPTARPTLPGRGQSSSARARGALQPPRGALQPLRVPPRTGGSRFKPAGGPTYMWLQPGHLRLQAGSTAGRRRKRTCATHGGCSRRSSCLSATAGSIARRCGSSSCAHRTRMMAVSPTSLAPRSNVVERTLARNYPCVRSPTAGAGQTPRARGASPCRVDAWGGVAAAALRRLLNIAEFLHVFDDPGRATSPTSSTHSSGSPASRCSAPTGCSRSTPRTRCPSRS